MRRTFLLNLGLVLLLNLLVKPFYILGIDAEVQVRTGTEVYGGYAALLSLSFLLNILLDLGITNWNTREMARHPHLMRKHVGGMLGARLLLVGLYAVVTLVFAITIGYQAQQMALLGVLILNQALAATLLYLRSNVAGAQRFAQDSMLSVLDRILLIAFSLWLLHVHYADAPFPIEAFVWAQTLAYAIAVVVAFALVHRISGGLQMKWERAFVVSILRQSLPYALLILLMTVYYRTDMVMLERLLPDGRLQAGIYAQGFRFFEAFNMLGFLFAGLLLPMFSRMLKLGQNTAPLVGMAWRLVLAGSIAVAVLGSVFAQEVMDLRYHEHTELSAPAFAVLIWCFGAVCTTYIFGTLLTATGDLGLLNRMAAGGMVLNVVLNLFLIPRYQALGAAWSSLITQSLTAAVQVWIAQRRCGLSGLLSVITRAAAFAAGLLALAFFLRSVEWAFATRMIVFAAVSMAWAFACGMVVPNVLSMLATLRSQQGQEGPDSREDA